MRDELRTYDRHGPRIRHSSKPVHKFNMFNMIPKKNGIFETFFDKLKIKVSIIIYNDTSITLVNSLSVTCCRSVVYSRYSGFLSQ